MKTDQTYRRARLSPRDMTFGEKWHEFIRDHGAKLIVAILLVSLIMPVFAEAAVATGAIVGFQTSRIPYPHIKPDPKIQVNGGKSPLYCLGLEVNEGRPLYMSDTNMRQHILVMGTTGAGKTELLLFLSAQAMAQGSGVLFVDGKGDVKTWFRLFAIASRLGVEENLLLLNFGTNIEKGVSRYELTNSINPFSVGSAAELSEMMSDLMAAASGDGAMWKGRAEGFMRDLMAALVYIRDEYGVSIGAGMLADYMPLDSLESLLGYGSRVNDPRFRYVLPEGSQPYIQIVRFLEALPGYTRPTAGQPGAQQNNQGRAEANKQLGFLSMQFTEILGLLNNSYRHMMGFDNAEVDIYDIILNRRSLYVMLPSMEKSAGTISNLGKIIVNQIRSSLSKTLGAAGVQGSRLEKLESRPTNSETPMCCILDEYGSYAPKGFGEVAAQARSIGFATIFAVQDYASLKKADEGKGDEALRIWANTNIKIVMKTEDSKETMQAVMERIGKGMFFLQKGKEINKGFFSSKWQNKGESGYEEVSRIDPLQLFDFENGRMLVINKSNLWIVQSTFLDNRSGPWQDLDMVYPQRFVPMAGTDSATAAAEIEILKQAAEGGVGPDEDSGIEDVLIALDKYREEYEALDLHDGETDPLRDGFLAAAFITRYAHGARNAAYNARSRQANFGALDTDAQDLRSYSTKYADNGFLEEKLRKQMEAEKEPPEQDYRHRPYQEEIVVADPYEGMFNQEPSEHYPGTLNKTVPAMDLKTYTKVAAELLDEAAAAYTERGGATQSTLEAPAKIPTLEGVSKYNDDDDTRKV